MSLKKYQPVFEIIILSIIAYAVHKVFFYFNAGNPDYAGFYHALETVYGFFSLCAIILIFILIQVRLKSIDNVGYTFLLLTAVQMAVSYAFLRTILNSGTPNIAIEKINFLIVFVLFLAIETIVTIRILNNKQ